MNTSIDIGPEQAGYRYYLAQTAVLLLVVAYLYAFVTSFRMPNLWSINYFMPSVFDGFYRRSLPGSVLYVFGDLRFNYYFIASIQIAIFLTLNYLFVKASFAHHHFKWIFAFFILAPTGGYLFHEIGYVDQLLFLVLIVAIYSNHALAGGILLVASLFIHEMALFFTVPLYLAYQIYSGEKPVRILATALTSLACFAFIYLFLQTARMADVASFIGKLQEAANWSVRKDYYEVFLNEFTGNRQRLYFGERDLVNFLLVSPIFALAAYVFSKKARSAPHAIALACVGAGAALSPLLLGFFGWDTSRWIFLSVSSAMFCLYIAREHLTETCVKIASYTLIVFTLFGVFEYFDGYNPKDRVDEGAHYFLIDELTHIPKA